MDSFKKDLFKDFLFNENRMTRTLQLMPFRENLLHQIYQHNIENDDIEEDFLIVEQINRGNSTKENKIKIKKFVEWMIPRFSDREFKSHFRLNRSSVEAILSHIGPLLLSSNMKINVEKQVLLFLWYMANCETHRQIANRFDVAESSSHTIITNCLLAFDNIAENIITWPTGQDAIDNVYKFNKLRGDNSFPNVFGCIDGCHISTLYPWEKRAKMPKMDRNMFCNRKQVPSIILQGIVDTDLKFINVFAGWPGRSHDARVFRCSRIGKKIMNNPWSVLPKSCHILGDGAYPLTKGLMVPYKDNGRLTREQKLFNHKLSSTRVLIEQAFGKLISRFRKLKHMDIYKKDFCGKIITAACCLHNICIAMNDDFHYDMAPSEITMQEYGDTTTTGVAKRDRICRLLANH